MTAKVENFCVGKKTKNISVDSGERVCINCIWYEQYYRQNRGNVQLWIPTSTGYCLLKDRQRGALMQSCGKYEAYEKSTRDKRKEAG